MPDYFQVKNWEQHQHYKDRTPPWIKLYNELLDDFHFSCLQDASKAHLVGIWLLASRTSNRIPMNAGWVGNKINATDPVDLNELLNSGFIEQVIEKPLKNQPLQEAEQDASTLQAKRLSREREEREGEERRKEREEKQITPTIVEDCEPTYKSKKGRTIKGNQLEWFECFWSAFDYKNSKAEAADSWIDIKANQDLMPVIIRAAEIEAINRPALKQNGRTPKMAQGWLSGRRWEDEQQIDAPAALQSKNKMDSVFDGLHIQQADDLKTIIPGVDYDA